VVRDGCCALLYPRGKFRNIFRRKLLDELFYFFHFTHGMNLRCSIRNGKFENLPGSGFRQKAAKACAKFPASATAATNSQSPGRRRA